MVDYINYLRKVTEFIRLATAQAEALNRGDYQQSTAFYELSKPLNQELVSMEKTH